MGHDAIIKRKLANKRAKIKNDYPKASYFINTLLFIKEIFVSAIRYVISRYKLRNVNVIGKYPFVIGSPILKTFGKVYIGDYLNITSNIVRTKIIVESNAILILGNDVRINGAHISVSSQVTIGDQVSIAPYTLIMDNDYHTIEDNKSPSPIETPFKIVALEAIKTLFPILISLILPCDLLSSILW
jgi:acetyltransferase-like isoleucine patch superfamily enzyme